MAKAGRLQSVASPRPRSPPSITSTRSLRLARLAFRPADARPTHRRKHHLVECPSDAPSGPVQEGSRGGRRLQDVAPPRPRSREYVGMFALPASLRRSPFARRPPTQRFRTGPEAGSRRLLCVALALLVASPALAGNGGIAPAAPNRQHRAIRDTYWLILGDHGRHLRARRGGARPLPLRYRRGRRDREAEGAQVHGQHEPRVVWTVVPVLIVGRDRRFVFASCPTSRTCPARRRHGERSVRVEATSTTGSSGIRAARFDRQDGRAGGQGRGRDGRRDDVIHSWWIPRSAARSTPSRPDQPHVVPGRQTGRTTAVRAALRHRARADALLREGRVEAAVPGVPRHAPPGSRTSASRDVRGRLRQVPRHAGQGRLRPAARRDRTFDDRQTSRAPPERARARCRRSAATGARPRSTR